MAPAILSCQGKHLKNSSRSTAASKGWQVRAGWQRPRALDVLNTSQFPKFNTRLTLPKLDVRSLALSLTRPSSISVRLQPVIETPIAGDVYPGGGPSVAEKAHRNGQVSKEYQWFMDTWDQGFTFNHQETPQGYWLDIVEGMLPEDLEGTFFRNGPGQFNMGKEKYAHPYDGDGLIVSIALKDQRAFLRSAYIRTPEYQLETQAQKVLFRGSFATQREGGPARNMLDMYIKNNSNTSCVSWNNKLLTMFEAAVPYKLDAGSLKTLGRELLEGQLNPGLPLDLGSSAANTAFGTLQRTVGSNALLPTELTDAGGDAFTAHTHVDANSGRLCLWTYKMKARGGFSAESDTCLTFWELDPDGSVAASKPYFIEGYGFMHDFALTKNYYVLFQPPIYVDVMTYVMGQACAASAVRWKRNTPTIIHVIPRPGSDAERLGEQPRQLTVDPPTFVFHHCNAFEDASGHIVVDSIHYDSLPAVGREALTQQQVDPNAAFRAKLRRAVLDMQFGIVKLDTLWDKPTEMPCINEAFCGKCHRYIYGYASIFDKASIGLAKVDTVTGQAQHYEPPPQVMLLEPRFVPRHYARCEDDGYLLCMAFDTQAMRSEFWVFDAMKLLEGPVARVALRNPVPHGLHGHWTSKYYGPQAGPY